MQSWATKSGFQRGSRVKRRGGKANSGRGREERPGAVRGRKSRERDGFQTESVRKIVRVDQRGTWRHMDGECLPENGSYECACEVYASCGFLWRGHGVANALLDSMRFALVVSLGRDVS